MPNVTKNYGLKKPLPEEFYDVAVQNENMDIIDGCLNDTVKKSGDTMTGDLNQRTYNAEGKWNSNEYRIGMRHTPDVSDPEQYSFLGVFGSADLKDAVQLWRKENGIEENYKILHTGNKNLIESSDIGAVSKSGDTMTGTLTVPQAVIDDNILKGLIMAEGTSAKLQVIAQEKSSGRHGMLIVSPNGLYFLNEDGYEYPVYHQGNAPAAIATSELV